MESDDAYGPGHFDTSSSLLDLELYHRPLDAGRAKSRSKFEPPFNYLCRRAEEALKSTEKALVELRIETLQLPGGVLRGVLPVREARSLDMACLRRVQNDLRVLLGFLFQMKWSALEFILGSENGRNTFAFFKDTLLNYGTSLEVARESSIPQGYIPATSSPILGALDVADQLYSELLRYGRSFDDFIYIASSLFVSVLEDSPSFSGYSESLWSATAARVEVDGALSLGQRFEEPLRNFGCLWVKQSLEAEAEAQSISTLESIHLDLIEKIGQFTDRHQTPQDDPIINDIKFFAAKEVDRVKGRKFSIAFCGMVKSGKSLFLNAFTKQQILPSDGLPTTAWPCRILHAPDYSFPRLSLNTLCFKEALQELQRRQICQTLKEYQPIKDFLSALADGDSTWDQSGSQTEKTREKELMYHAWKDLHPSMKQSLEEFEVVGHQLPASASGDLEVAYLLGKVNDLVRICRIFGIELPDATPETWPIIHINLEAMKNLGVGCEIEFIDLPGIGEANSNFHKFEDLVRIAASEADSIIPIISLSEVARGDWRNQLVSIVKTGLGRAPDYVVCTHLDKFPLNRVQSELVPSVGKEFWPALANFNDRVLFCSPRLGIGAETLIELSRQSKPSFNQIWEDHPIQYDCAKSILGTEAAEELFLELSHSEWLEELDEQLSNSNLPSTVSHLINGIISNAQTTALLVEGEKLRHIMQKAAADQRRCLLEISRSEEDFQIKYHGFLHTQRKLKHLQETSANENKSLQGASRQTLDQAYTILVQEVEKFYHAAQDDMTSELKNNVTRKFVAFVRELAERSRAKLFDVLVSELEQAVKNDEESKELVGDILEKLPYEAGSVDVLYSSRLKHRVIRTNIQHHSLSTAYSSIRDIVAKPFLKPTGRSSMESPYALTNGGGLGFMFRAPIAVLAAIPLILGSPIWPFVTYKKKYFINKKTLAKHFEEEIQKPFFLALKKEAEETLDKVIQRSYEDVQAIVDVSLKEEEARFEREKSLKKLSHHDTIALTVNTASLLWNFSAAERGLLELQNYLKVLLP
ncbi:hypothetical protein SCHPADRAFT_926651 [Schizopora paradoxa]|uniref:Dynamin N-terminal domain-containing protein n=1 Tax=Schizopora paradoxa TaxID=27342 RepID=A0A0H2RWP8_9AGAM|nr:hypothetical protein SCHPADRAFT_926651 [Schizopora paradoxa]